MHVFSSEQFQKLMDASGFTGPWHSVMDLGAGDGATTAHVAHLFEKVYATDISPPMRWALARRKFTYVHFVFNLCRENVFFFYDTMLTVKLNSGSSRYTEKKLISPKFWSFLAPINIFLLL